jgi:hypothetical protein
VIKHNFDQTPKLLETFDQLIRSSEIRSSDPLSTNVPYYLNVVPILNSLDFVGKVIKLDVIFNLKLYLMLLKVQLYDDFFCFLFQGGGE